MGERRQRKPILNLSHSLEILINTDNQADIGLGNGNEWVLFGKFNKFKQSMFHHIHHFPSMSCIPVPPKTFRKVTQILRHFKTTETVLYFSENILNFVLKRLFNMIDLILKCLTVKLCL